MKLIQYLFDQSAERYESDIVPVLTPLAADFVTYVAPRRHDRVMDIGTGTGLVARLLAPQVHSVIGVDLSHASLHVARQTTTSSMFIQADLNRMPIASGQLSLVVASFGLNATDPARSLPAIHRIIAPGGRFMIQEWGPISEVDRALENALLDHLTDSPGDSLAALREQLEEMPSPWLDQIQDTDDYFEWLTDAGFEVEDARESAPVVVRMNAEDYLRYKLAWTYRWEEVQAMSPDQRADFLDQARAILAEASAPDGSFVWQPILFRAAARVAK